VSSEPTSADAGLAVKPPFLTFVLIAVNVLIYMLIQYQGGPTYENLIRYGAKENGLIAEGEIGRLFFPMFLHASPAHILFNMFALYQFGRIFEVLTGARNFFVTYVLGGLAGNAVSFTFTRSLSVGASSSLFALLMALYVLERYQLKINAESTGIKAKTSLGPIIIINAVITFVIPNIDWASHLGGAIAGAFIGAGIVMRHKMSVRMMSMVKYWRVDNEILNVKFYHREGFYLGTVAFLVLISLSKIPAVAFADRVFGLGVLDASQTKLHGHLVSELPDYRNAFNDALSPANPEQMIHYALEQHVAGKYESSEALFSVLLKMNQSGLGKPEFSSKSTEALLEQAIEYSHLRRQLDSGLIEALSDEQRSVKGDPQFCRKAADYVRGLGFFGLSGLLYKCAFYEDFGNKNLARHAIADLWLNTRRCEGQTPREILITEDDTRSVSDLRQAEKLRRRNCFFDLELFRSELIRGEESGLLDARGAKTKTTDRQL
jgi:membrane associated rhomboid family serine protease